MKSLMVIDINNEVMKEQNAERLSEYEKAQIEFAKGKAEFLQGCGGCLMIPIIIIIRFNFLCSS